MSVARQAGYRLLGTRLDYLLHLRPAEWPIVAGHTALGYLLAVGPAGALAGTRWREAALGIVLWVVCLNGGTLALNSAFDRDEGDIAYLRRPPPPPRGLAPASLALMLAGQALAFALPPGYRIAYAACVVMSLVYLIETNTLRDMPALVRQIGDYARSSSWEASDLIKPLTILVLIGFR